MKFGIKEKFIVVFVLMIFIPLTILGVFSYVNSASTLTESYEMSNTKIVEEVAREINNYFHSFETAAEIFAESNYSKNVLKMKNGDENYNELMRAYQAFVDSHEEIHFVYMGVKDKRMLDPSWLEVTIDEYDPTSRDWYQMVEVKQETIWTSPYTDAQTGETIVSVATPVYSFEDEFVGAVAIDISLNNLSKVVNSIVIGKEGYPVLVSDELLIITHKEQELLGKALPVDEINDALSKNDEGLVEYVHDGIDKFATFTKIEDINWYVLVTMNKSEIRELTNPIMYTTLILGVICLIIAIVVAVLISNNFVRPISKLEGIMENVRNGDLTVRSENTSKDEIGRMSSSFNVMLDSFSSMLKKTKLVSDQVSESASVLASNSIQVSVSSEEIAKTSEEIALGASNQAGETEKGVNLIGELAKKIDDLSVSSKVMEEVTDGVIKSNETGSRVVGELKQKNMDNNEATYRIEKVITELERKSKEIGGILETISSIADQTNLLALNASIESARAGEAGKGFAVVAEEIRKLAEESSVSAENIKNIVTQIQNESQNAVKLMGEVKTRTSEQNEAVVSVEKVFEEVTMAIKEMSGLITNTTLSVTDMNNSKDSIIESIEMISSVSEESAAASEEVTASIAQQTEAIEDVANSANLLNDMAEELKREINNFKV